MFVLMVTWREGQSLVRVAHKTGQMDLKQFLDDLFGSFKTQRLQSALEVTQAKLNKLDKAIEDSNADDKVELIKQQSILQNRLAVTKRCQVLFDNIKKVKGIAVFLVAEQDIVPVALKQNLKHNKCLHEYNIFVTVNTHEVPWIGMNKRTEVTYLGNNCWKVILNFGFKNDPDVPDSLKHIEQFNFDFDPARVSYFLSHEAVVPTPAQGMALWREKLFAHMHRNAGTAAEFLKLPSNNVVEMGAKLEI